MYHNRNTLKYAVLTWLEPDRIHTLKPNCDNWKGPSTSVPICEIAKLSCYINKGRGQRTLVALGFCCTLKAPKKKMLRHRSHQKLCVYTDRSPLRLEKEAQASSPPGFRRAGNCPADAAVSLPLPRLSQLLFLHLWQREKVLQLLFPGYCMTDSPHTCFCNPWGRHRLSSHLPETSAASQIVA